MSLSFLVTAANGDIADAIGRILREIYPDSRIYGADLGDIWPGNAIFDQMHVLPRGDSDDYVQALIDLVKKIGISVVIPASEPELVSLARAGDMSRELPLLMCDPETILCFTDKLESYRWFSDHDFPMPYTTLVDKVSTDILPVIVKPRSSSGSRLLEIVRTPEQLKIVKESKGQGFVAQQFIEGDDREFTCAVFRIDDDVRTLAMRRQMLGGITSSFIVEQRQDITDLLVGLAHALNLRGSINVQLRLAPDGPSVFEINPRFSSTVMMRHKIGFSDLVWSLEAKVGQVVSDWHEVQDGCRVFRRFTELVVGSC